MPSLRKEPSTLPISLFFNKILGSIKKEGISVVPISLYFSEKGKAKLTIGLAKGKKKQDKRSSIKDKEWDINRQRMVKNRQIK